MPDEPQLSDATLAEQELGRKLAKQNADNYERAQRARAAETAKPEDPEAQAAVDEALRQAETRKPRKEKQNE